MNGEELHVASSPLETVLGSGSQTKEDPQEATDSTTGTEILVLA
jgi:hypothetical protein